MTVADPILSTADVWLANSFEKEDTGFKNSYVGDTVWRKHRMIPLGGALDRAKESQTRTGITAK